MSKNKISGVDYDSTLRLYDLDLRHKVKEVWDENIPIINHTVIEGRGGVSFEFLNSTDAITIACDKFCKSLGLSVVDRAHHQFEPFGKTVFFVLEESHISIHTWPEREYLHLDLVTCQEKEMSPLQIATLFDKHFKPTHMRCIKLRY